MSDWPQRVVELEAMVMSALAENERLTRELDEAREAGGISPWDLAKYQRMVAAEAEVELLAEENERQWDSAMEVLRQRDAARADAERLRAELRDAIETIDRAVPGRHSPWCNEVHEGSFCEGDCLMGGLMERLRALAKGEP